MVNQNNPFEERIENFEKSLRFYRNKANSFSWLRTLAFLATALLFYYYFTGDNYYFGIGALLVMVAFLSLISIHRKYKYQTELHECIIAINEEEILKSKLHLNDFDEGTRFAEDNHPYADDLDVFGKHSLFQLLNRCEIENSKEKLAYWLKEKAGIDTIMSRQETVRSLLPQQGWMQQFSATLRLAMSKRKKHEPDVTSADIIHWSKESIKLKVTRVKWLALVLGFIFSGLAVVVILSDLPYLILIPSAVINLIFVGIANKHIEKATKGIDGAKAVLNSYENAIREVLILKSSNAKISRYQQELKETHALASIEKLRSIIYRLSARGNMFYFIANVALLLDTHLMLDLEKWRRKYEPNIEHWLDIIHEIECLVSLASFKINRPEFTFPELSSKPFLFEATALGHPLIADQEKITNDYFIQAKGTVDILTGSNMSGKSTFQRTVGVNMVLAQMGATVNAQKLTSSPTRIFTSMRTKDNLEEHTSSFYAELKRIRQLLDQVESEEPVYFLLDEILKGTNSEDRHIGAVALANQLSAKSAFGIISTHDLKLSEVAKENERIRNYSFNSEIIGEKISFDYKLTEGVCKSFNASQLMKNMGILK